MNTATVTSIKSKTKVMRPLNESVDLVLKRIESNSSNTATSYRGFYKEFFIYAFGKQYTDCTWDDLLSLGYDDILEYVSVLEAKNSPKTVKTKLYSLQSLVKELKKINHDINTIVFDVKLDKREMENNEYGAFTEEEIYQLLDYAKNLNSEKAYVQYMFFKLSVATAHRVTSILNLTWKDIKQVKEEGRDIWTINVKDKTGCFETPISDDLYDELNALHRWNDDEKVVKISTKTLSLTLTNFCKDMNIDQKGRNLVLHSIKKSSGDICYKRSGNDIVAVASHLHHSNINTAYNHYLNKNKKLADSHSYTMFGENEDLDDLLNSLSKDELINMIKGCNPSTISEICKKIKEA